MVMGLTAVAEELLFRAGMQRIAMDFLGSAWLGILVTAVVFGALHFRTYRSLLARVAIVGISLVFGWTYWWTGNLAVVVWCHFVFNVLPIIAKLRKNRKFMKYPVDLFIYRIDFGRGEGSPPRSGKGGRADGPDPGRDGELPAVRTAWSRRGWDGRRFAPLS